ncbi:hypothetical protein HYFRA_00004521 [Hymenoscyphus fraxineus]|uniref:Uncharacterized protein n=1 Tax=Hymenoscyphus fraxineus TaxID=746836 RepID=A0A9N9KZ45_9HELO|nr:hypothetical protein HYFRA_00004521 [Hymenoscyphus fraxineus]
MSGFWSSFFNPESERHGHSSAAISGLYGVSSKRDNIRQPAAIQGLYRVPPHKNDMHNHDPEQNHSQQLSASRGPNTNVMPLTIKNIRKYNQKTPHNRYEYICDYVVACSDGSSDEGHEPLNDGDSGDHSCGRDTQG